MNYKKNHLYKIIENTINKNIDVNYMEKYIKKEIKQIVKPIILIPKEKYVKKTTILTFD